jgi:hypothetical protein
MRRVAYALRSTARDAGLIWRSGNATVVVSAGMPRSGSTLVFNVLREYLTRKFQDRLATGWVNDLRMDAAVDALLVKTHVVTPLLNVRSNYYFYSFRDVRDALLSAQRKFGREPTIHACGHYIKGFAHARRYAHAVLRYEDFSRNNDLLIQAVGKVLGDEHCRSGILQLIPKPNQGPSLAEAYDPRSLLHANHATGTMEGEWRSELGSDLLKEIDRKFGWWLDENRYPRSNV